MTSTLLAAAAALLVAAAACLVAVRRRLLITVEGVSMQPTLRAGDVLIGRRAGLRALRAGALVIVERPDPSGGWPAPGTGRPRRWMVKRVAALPGDPMPAAVAACAAGAVVPPGTVVVLGDNRAASIDSRTLGPVPADRLLGLVLRRHRPGPAARPLAPPDAGTGVTAPVRRRWVLRHARPCVHK
ncbi:S26 family signal peptidase [Streptomyces sp. NRRL B-24484]|uniref:S26 family signal peptidase n=1 Tax=Streptomyces sp. NRRL B-24484 TaxID=1463833 RepID=UPI000694C319|nr:S26 family signal peptidase [Streptomyces sp. NRRL B-24484]